LCVCVPGGRTSLEQVKEERGQPANLECPLNSLFGIHFEQHHLNNQFYGHYGVSQHPQELEDFVGGNFNCPHADSK